MLSLWFESARSIPAASWGAGSSSGRSGAWLHQLPDPLPPLPTSIPLPDSSSSGLSSLYHTMLGMCAPATGHLISKESLTFTRRSVKFCVSRGTSRAGGGVETELIGASESGRALQEGALQGWELSKMKGQVLSSGVGRAAHLHRRAGEGDALAGSGSVMDPPGACWAGGEGSLGSAALPCPQALPASPCTDRYFLWQCLSWLRRSCTSHT